MMELFVMGGMALFTLSMIAGIVWIIASQTRKEQKFLEGLVDGHRRAGFSIAETTHGWTSSHAEDGSAFATEWVNQTTIGPHCLCTVRAMCPPWVEGLSFDFKIRPLGPQSMAPQLGDLPGYLELDGVRIEADLQTAYRPFAAAAVADLQDRRGVTRVRGGEGWIEMRCAIPGSQFDGDPAKGLVEVHRGILRRVRTLRPSVDDPASLWLELYEAMPAFSRSRRDALQHLLTTHAGTDAAERAWEYVIEYGNLYEILLILNTDRRRAIAALHPARLVSFVNAVLQDPNYDRGQVASALSEAFDETILEDVRMDWDGRRALLQVWLGVDRTEALATTVGRVFAAERDSEVIEDLRGLVEQQAWWQGAAAISGAVSALGDDRRAQRVAVEMLASVSAPDEEFEPDVETFLLELYRSGRTEAVIVRALGHWGGARALQLLDEASDSAFGLTPTAREAKDARILVQRRLEAQPSAGALSMAVDAEAGTLSLTDDG
jgi:hypothetical protein